MITVKILADSINPAGSRLTSWLLTYPRFIHAEFMTHRCFSRNAASSRAIPFHKMMEEVCINPALPEYWGAEKKGMQSGDRLDEREENEVFAAWMNAKNNALGWASTCSGLGLHKSLCNRLIEPFSHITVLATATDHRNFFALRAHPEAMPEFQVLAYRMLAEYLKNEPKEAPWGGWHIPQFENAPSEQAFAHTSDRLKIATARCARLSYLTHDGEISYAKDIELHDRLLASGHMSPFEHCAEAVDPDIARYPRSNFDFSGSRCGWRQYRKNFAQENRTVVDYDAIMASKPEWITV